MSVDEAPDGARVTSSPTTPRHGQWSALLPLAATVTGCVALLARFDTPVAVSALFVAYLTVMVALPGTLAWRMLGGRRGPFVEQVAVGSALALATQAILGFGLAPLHAGRLSWLWAPLVVLLSVVPRFRRTAWSAPRAPQNSIGGSWVQAVAVLSAALWVSTTSLSVNPVSVVDGNGPWARAVPTAAYVDMPFHQSVAAGIDQFYPLVYPYLYDEPLRYHLLAYEHLAGVSTLTGIDLTWLLYRLDVIALVALAVVAVGALARRASGFAYAAPVAAVLAVLSSAAAPYGWTATPFTSAGLLQSATFRSPTHTFGQPLFLAALTVAVIALRPVPRSARDAGLPGHELANRPPHRAGLVAAFAVLAVGAGGAKSTMLPVLIAGLALVALDAVLRRRALLRPALLLATAVAAFLLLIAVFLGGQTGSLSIAPMGVVTVFWVFGAVGQGVGSASRAGLGALGSVAWLVAGAGGVLLARRARRADPAVPLLIGTAVAGPAAALLTTASGASEVYFLYASWPVLVVVAVWGWAELWAWAARRGMRRHVLTVSVVSALLGPALVLLARAVSGRAVPSHAVGDLPVRALVAPWLVLAAGACGVGVVTYLTTRRGRSGALLAVALVALTLTSTTAVTRPGEIADGVLMLATGDLPGPEGDAIPPDGARAALFVRDHSAVDDVVATNAHCIGPTLDPCDARHFWVSALTERRVLLEGWAYPEGFRPGLTRTSPFWDTARYDANQIVFAAPTQANVNALRDRYGVRWLFVDRTAGRESDRLRDVAELVLDEGDAAVYRVNG